METKSIKNTRNLEKEKEQKKVSENKKKPYRDIANVFEGKIIYSKQEDIFNLSL
jgi:hypothetical protein